MRVSREQHLSMFSQYSDHSFSAKLGRISKGLDGYPEICDLVLSDLAHGKDPRGARGMSAEEVLRAAILMRIQDWTYVELEYNLVDSQSARAFARIRDGRRYSDSTLQENIKAISAETWEQLNRKIVREAKVEGFEKGRVTCTDSTVAKSNIHYPSDSTLILDCLRVVSRIFCWMKKCGASVVMKSTFKKARKLALEILGAKNEEERKPLYEELIIGAGDVFWKLDHAKQMLRFCKDVSARAIQSRADEIAHIQDCLEGILAQSIARVLDKKSVAAKDKIVSVFETHTDVIVKGRRDTEFGHKINLTTGKSNLVIDCTVEAGNPSDSDKYLEMLNRQKDIYGVYPRQTTCDGGYASKENLENAKALGVKDVCFSKRCGMEKEKMCSSKSVFEKLRKLRAGIEGTISALKRAFGMRKVTWKGLEGFKSYIWSSVVSHNLKLLAS